MCVLQTCFIEIGTWQFKATEVDIFCAADSFDESSYVDHTQWVLLGWFVASSESVLSSHHYFITLCCTVSFRSI